MCVLNHKEKVTTHIRYCLVFYLYFNILLCWFLDICRLPKVQGACEGYYPSWYYDKDRKQCAQFIWGGCLGNANRFETREECQDLCVVDRDQGKYEYF